MPNPNAIVGDGVSAVSGGRGPLEVGTAIGRDCDNRPGRVGSCGGRDLDRVRGETLPDRIHSSHGDGVTHPIVEPRNNERSFRRIETDWFVVSEAHVNAIDGNAVSAVGCGRRPRNLGRLRMPDRRDGNWCIRKRRGRDDRAWL